MGAGMGGAGPSEGERDAGAAIHQLLARDPGGEHGQRVHPGYGQDAGGAAARRRRPAAGQHGRARRHDRRGADARVLRRSHQLRRGSGNRSPGAMVPQPQRGGRAGSVRRRLHQVERPGHQPAHRVRAGGARRRSGAAGSPRPVLHEHSHRDHGAFVDAAGKAQDRPLRAENPARGQ